jgi:hypothetical protein
LAHPILRAHFSTIVTLANLRTRRTNTTAKNTEPATWKNKDEGKKVKIEMMPAISDASMVPETFKRALQPGQCSSLNAMILAVERFLPH